MNKHTPGPWAAEFGSYGSFAIEAERAGIGGGLLVLASRNQHPLLADQMHANARLIAAAPDLLEALRTADRTFAENGLLACHAARQEIRAAIAKAEGQ